MTKKTFNKTFKNKPINQQEMKNCVCKQLKNQICLLKVILEISTADIQASYKYTLFSKQLVLETNYLLTEV